jgi:oligoendopeptidase F
VAIALPNRADIAQETTWDAYSIFPDHTAWEAALQSVLAELPALAQYQGTLASGPAHLADWLQKEQALSLRGWHVMVYASMFHNTDTSDAEAAARYGRAMGVLSKVRATVAFARPEMLALPDATLQEWMRTEPRLAPYAHFFDLLARQRPHVRSAEVEEMLGQVSDPFGAARQIHGTLSDADLRFAPSLDSAGEASEIGQGTIGALLHSADRETRRTAWENYSDAYLAHKNTIANCLSAGVKQNVFLARARRYNSALEAALTPNHIPVEVFHNLIATFRKHLPTWHRYWDIRRRALKLDRLHVYDITAPLSEQPPVIPYAQAVDWIAEGMAPLGEEYVSILRRGSTTDRWVDIYPNRGKRMGAYSSGAPGLRPFILMSYNDDVFSLSTLAHELGHSLHSYYTWQTQPPMYCNYGTFLAEVASNVNQAMVRAHLLKTQTDRDFQIAVLEEAMANFHRYFFIMPTLARFELEIHERVERGESLTAQSLIQRMAELFQEGYGDGVEVDTDRVGITWAEFPTHLYSNFYVFQYATGISGANALTEGIRQEGAPAAERYLTFLKTGGSRFPFDTLRDAGVDLASPEPVERAFAVFASYVDRLDTLLNTPHSPE